MPQCERWSHQPHLKHDALCHVSEGMAKIGIAGKAAGEVPSGLPRPDDDEPRRRGK